MTGQRQYREKKKKDWVFQEGSIITAAVLAAGAQETETQHQLEHPTTSEDYGSGTLEGLRLTVTIDPGAADINIPPEVVFLKVPLGGSVPTINTNASMKANEDKIWLVGKAKHVLKAAAGSLRAMFVYEANPKTARTFQKGDTFTVVVINRDATSFANPHTVETCMEVYCVE